MEVIAKITTDFSGKFGIPRQSGLVDGLRGVITFEPGYRFPEAVRGLEEFSHIWLIWGFSGVEAEQWSPTVRPPKLGGNERRGVFATRSPFRPNSLGLSCVKLEKVEPVTPDGPKIYVSGVDLMDSTPIYDIKPYVPYADCHPGASGGFSKDGTRDLLDVVFPDNLKKLLPEDKACALEKLLSLDPRPSYHDDGGRVYGFGFAGAEIRFSVKDKTVFVKDVIKR